MTYSELFDAIQNHPSEAGEALPPSADVFAKYLRDAGIKRYSPRKGRKPTGSIRTEAQVERARQTEPD